MKNEIYIDERHIDKLFEVTELHYKWLNKYYPNIKHNYSSLLQTNYSKLVYFVLVDLLGQYDSVAIDNKMRKMHSAYLSLFEISEYNRENNKIDGMIAA